MPSVDDNLNQWSNHEWSSGGDEWSVGYGGTESMWTWAIRPRIGAFLPAAHVLEIAPGFGRITQYLAPSTPRLTVVDLTQRCIDACKERFKELDHIEYHVNDGRSLAMVPDDSVDFVFSWDSLIHVEEDVIKSYLEQLATKLVPGGTGILHHSNMDAYRGADGELTVENVHWRAASMSAAKFRGFCRDVGLRCLVQELVPWGGPEFTDCISVFRRESPGLLRRPHVIENHDFFAQVQQHRAADIRALTRAYREL
ncbi:hypothetical protein [Alloactinosynnema sp. L-07]|uniref:class I SAM-dependent methyltransferase n=1 Tax=Alloactinosynnema sp. L-07 TaxID=1653480 RepID=UPI00065EFC67|nr:class I SAM-dependent methyltransferase [Alloactinosynnema sp. L-07]CRK58796.1 hypothetical protein [Alloactinosynnema sp. L-07]